MSLVCSSRHGGGASGIGTRRRRRRWRWRWGTRCGGGTLAVAIAVADAAAAVACSQCGGGDRVGLRKPRTEPRGASKRPHLRVSAAETSAAPHKPPAASHAASDTARRRSLARARAARAAVHAGIAIRRSIGAQYEGHGRAAVIGASFSPGVGLLSGRVGGLISGSLGARSGAHRELIGGRIRFDRV